MLVNPTVCTIPVSPFTIGLCQGLRLAIKPATEHATSLVELCATPNILDLFAASIPATAVGIVVASSSASSWNTPILSVAPAIQCPDNAVEI